MRIQDVTNFLQARVHDNRSGDASFVVQAYRSVGDGQKFYMKVGESEDERAQLAQVVYEANRNKEPLLIRELVRLDAFALFFELVIHAPTAHDAKQAPKGSARRGSGGIAVVFAPARTAGCKAGFERRERRATTGIAACAVWTKRDGRVAGGLLEVLCCKSREAGPCR